MSASTSRAKGFTLIELMIVVVIVAILAAIGVPAYTDYVRRGKISEAVSQLSAMKVKLEQFYQDNRTYVGACAAGTLAPLPGATEVKYFAFTCPTLTATTFTVRADGVAAQGMAAFVYSIDQTNTRTTLGLPAGWSGTASSCWVTKKDGSC